MGSLVWLLGFVLCCGFVKGNNVSVNVSVGAVLIDGKDPIATIDEDFICATLDWWPPEKCDYGTCSWDHASLLNLDLNNVIFLNAVKAFSPLKIRLGGTLQDRLIYQTPDNLQKPCTQFAPNRSELFFFTQGCLPLARWDQLNSFFKKSGAVIIFGLNALQGKTIQRDSTATGPWDPSNAASLIRYSVQKGYHDNIYAWELGNELSGNGIGAKISADAYASDTDALHDLVQNIYKGIDDKPQILAPGGFFDADWFEKYLAKTVGSINAITHHIYSLGPGSDPHLIDRILDPNVLDSGADVFRQLRDVVKASPNVAPAWVGEAGGAYNSGRNRVTNAFVFSFWYLDQLGASSTYDTKVYCRQSLIGGNYGLLNTTTFVPNPDYYSALLWHRLMGRKVLSASFTGKRTLRTYAHCAKQSKGVTLLLINIDSKATVQAGVNFNANQVHMDRQRNTSHHHHLDRQRNTSHHHHRHHHYRHHIPVHHSKQVSSVREEYHLTPLNGDIQSQTVLLNGKALRVDSSGNIPVLEPVKVKSSEPVTVAPYSIVFVSMPDAGAVACT